MISCQLKLNLRPVTGTQEHKLRKFTGPKPLVWCQPSSNALHSWLRLALHPEVQRPATGLGNWSNSCSKVYNLIKTINIYQHISNLNKSDNIFDLSTCYLPHLPVFNELSLAFICAMRSSMTGSARSGAPPLTSTTSWPRPRKGSCCHDENKIAAKLLLQYLLQYLCCYMLLQCHNIIRIYRSRIIIPCNRTWSTIVASPEISTEPLGAIFWPLNNCSRVDLPAPLRPTQRHRAPASKEKLMPGGSTWERSEGFSATQKQDYDFGSPNKVALY